MTPRTLSSRFVLSALLTSSAAVCPAAALQPPASQPPAPAPSSLAEALTRLQDSGLPIVYSTEVVRPEMEVDVAPAAGDEPRAALDALLAPHGLGVVEGPRGVLVVVRLAPAGDCSVVGEVRDASGRPISGAEVSLVDAARRTRTDAAGRFRLGGLPGGEYSLSVRAEGHLEGSTRLTLNGESVVHVELAGEPFLDEEIVVRPSRWPLIEDELAGELVFGREEIDELPHLGGEALRVLSVAPGVATNDLSARFAVRGGRRDEVAIRLDGQELYEPYHLKDYDSVLSIVPTEALASMTLTTGGLPAARGDRMGGVLELTTSASTRSPDVRFGIGPLHALAVASGALGDAGWSVLSRVGSGRFAERVLGDDEEPSFWDAFGRLEIPLGGTLLTAHGLAASDTLELEERTAEESESVLTDYASRYGWLNHDAALRDGLFVTSHLSWAWTERNRRGTESEEDGSFVVRDGRLMDVAGLSQTWTAQRQRHRLELGWEAQRFDARLDYQSTIARDVAVAVAGGVATESVPRIDRRLTDDHYGAWLSDRFTIAGRWTAELGVRYDRHTLTDDTLLSPRVNLARRMGEQGVLRASWGVFHQSQRPYELEVQDGQRRLEPAERSTQWVLGYERLFDVRSVVSRVRVEAFGRRVGNPRQRFLSLLEPINVFPETEPDRVRIDPEETAAEGLELLVRGREGDLLSWWLAYTYIESRLELAGGEVPSTYDQPHALTLDVGRRLGRHWRLNAAWHYHTGWPTTPVIGLRAEPAAGAAGEDGEDGEKGEDGEDGAERLTLALGPLNGGRLPPYHRLDLRLHRRWSFGRSSLRFFVEVQNLYGRRNRSGFDPEIDEELGTVTLEPEEWPGIVPSFGIVWEP